MGVELFGGLYSGKRVLVTGHTGFKGSWLCLLLKKLGAEIIGYALGVPTEPNHFELVCPQVISVIGDIRDRERLFQIFKKYSPEVVFHLAAQPIVRRSYSSPVETLETNVMGTVNVLEAARRFDSVKALVLISSDKCYENREWLWGYRESDRLGGYDPYSASKACIEIIAGAYRRSFFHPEEYGKEHHVLVATARSGNVIGGGDWGEDRLIPDLVRACAKGEKAIIRSPDSVRPWQHVLEPLVGYLLLGSRLLAEEIEFADAWNFGPDEPSEATVIEVVQKMKFVWKKIDYVTSSTKSEKHESKILRLDCSKARMRLSWKPVWNLDKAINVTAAWYREFYERGNVRSSEDLDEYVHDASTCNAVWTSKTSGSSRNSKSQEV